MKSMVIAALFLAFLASSNGAVTVRTTIITKTTTEDGEASPAGKESTREYCRDEVQTAVQLRECMMYASEGSPYGSLALRMVVNRRGEQVLQQCCKKLVNVQEQCRCGVVDEMINMMQKQQEGGQQNEKQKKMMMQQIKNLPKMCKLEPQVC